MQYQRRTVVGVAVALLLCIGTLIVFLRERDAGAGSVSGPTSGPDARSRPGAAVLDGVELPSRAPSDASTSIEGETDAASEPKPGDLRGLLREIADVERAIIARTSRGLPAQDSELQARLEAAIGPLLEDSNLRLQLIPLMHGGDAVDPPLDDEERYGAVRAVYWTLVVLSGRGQEQTFLLSLLDALPSVDPEVVSYLVDNITQAATDGVPVLDASYTEAILRLRAQYPEHKELFSRLFERMGEGLAPKERDAFYAIFLPENDDPTLAGIAIENLLEGSDPELGMFLAGERIDDPETPDEVRRAIAAAVIQNAEPIAATRFMSDRAELFESQFELWVGLGQSQDARDALASEYHLLLERDVSPDARRMLVFGMRNSRTEDVLEIARTDPDQRVVGQALMTAMNTDGWNSGESIGETLTILEQHRATGGIDRLSAVTAASRIVRAAHEIGRIAERDAAVGILADIARDSANHETYRREAIKALKGFLSPGELDALSEGL